MRQTSFFRSTTFRLALIYLCLFSAALCVLLGIMYWTTVGSISRQIDATIDAEITGLAEQYRQGGILGLIAAIERRSNAPIESRGHAIHDKIVASGLDGVFPKGFNVGEVSGVIRRAAGIFQEVTITPYVDFEKLEEVIVILSPPKPEFLKEQ